MKKIKIIAVPPGFAPDKIRKQWVGVEIPLATKKDFAEDPVSGVTVVNENANGYVVLRSKAIIALYDAGRNEAAAFWESLPLGRYLEFKKEICEAA